MQVGTMCGVNHELPSALDGKATNIIRHKKQKLKKNVYFLYVLNTKRIL